MDSFDKEVVVGLTGASEEEVMLLGVTDEGETLVEGVLFKEELVEEGLLCIEDVEKVLLEGLTDSIEELFLDCFEEEYEE